ncbi:MAG TPA: peptidylprolyl isomerase [Segetibacter sp.]|jgi:peptidyl-prolyl cis-trans isomerase A (cyclophilin A)
MKNICKILLILSLASCSQKYKNPHVVIKTKFGEIELELYPDQAPKSVAAFLENIDAGYYENSSFYRVLSRDNQPSDADKTELIQGGIWRAKNKRDINRAGIPHETTAQTKVLHKDGVISFARLEPGTATTEFFICIDDQPSLDFGSNSNPDKQGYAAFGKVVKGMNIVRRIHNQNADEQSFDPPVDIYKIVQL